MATSTAKKKAGKKPAARKSASKKARPRKKAATVVVEAGQTIAEARAAAKKKTGKKAPAQASAKKTAAKKATSKKGREMAELPPAKKGSLRLAGERYIALLPTLGHSPATVGSYTGDIRLIVDVLGGDKALRSIKAAAVTRFFGSKRFNFKRDGATRKAEPSLNKSRRAVRQFFEWCVAEGLVAKAPLPEDARSKKKATAKKATTKKAGAKKKASARK